MAWYDDSAHPFAGIAAKLKRAEQNIINLDGEISAFFDACKYPILLDENTEEWQYVVDYHIHLAIPIRFSVLCGEIIHHLRSCLDHIAWYFSSSEYRLAHEAIIQFPVLAKLPNKDDLARYNRNIKGITNANLRTIIDKLQPYHRGSGAGNHPVSIIHDMDRIEKHRELVIIGSCVSIVVHDAVTISDMVTAVRYSQGEILSSDEIEVAQRTLKAHVKATPQVAFRQFGNGKTKPVVPSLKQLLDVTDKIVGIFANEV